MTSLYTPQAKAYINSRPWPVQLNWVVTEHYDPDFLRFNLYRDNLNSLDGEEKKYVAAVMNEALSKISRSGIPIFTKVHPGRGPEHERDSLAD